MKLPRKSEKKKQKLVDTVGRSRFAQVENPGRYPPPCLEGAKWDLSLSGFLCSSCAVFLVFRVCIAHFSQSLYSVNETLSF